MYWTILPSGDRGYNKLNLTKIKWQGSRLLAKTKYKEVYYVV